MENNRFNNNEKNKFNFTEKKDCAINSIKEIEFFLRNLEKAIKSFKIYKFIK